MEFNDKIIKDILIKENYITEEDVKNAENFTRIHPSSFVEYLFQENLITRDLLGQAIAESFKVPYADLNSTQPTLEQIKKIPEDVAKKYRAVVFSEKKNEIVITTDTPDDKNLLPELTKLFAGKSLGVAYSAY